MPTLASGCLVCGTVSTKGRKGPWLFCSLECAWHAPSLEWTPELAYLSGLVTSDGCLHHKKQGGYRAISFVSTEPNLIETTSRLVRDAGATPHLGGGGVTDSGKPYERVKWTDYRMYSTFLRMGLHPNKSKTMKALKLPLDKSSGSNYFWLFLRGLFDGDGTITLNETGTPRDIRFVTGSPIFAKWVKRELYLRGVYNVSEFCSWEGHKEARILSVSTQHTHFLKRKMYDEWESRFGDLGHREKKRRVAVKRVPIDSSPGRQKIRLTLPKIEASFLLCYEKLNRWPNSKEYTAVRDKELERLKDPREFPCPTLIFRRFGSWEEAIRHMQEKHPELPSHETLTIEQAFLKCHQELGHWPTTTEYDYVRNKLKTTSKRSRDFVASSSIFATFSTWEKAVNHMRELYPRLADPPRLTTRDRIENAMISCYQQLGRWPETLKEYEILRRQHKGSPRTSAFPSYPSIRGSFGGWPQLVEHMEALSPVQK